MSLIELEQLQRLFAAVSFSALTAKSEESGSELSIGGENAEAILFYLCFRTVSAANLSQNDRHLPRPS